MRNSYFFIFDGKHVCWPHSLPISCDLKIVVKYTQVLLCFPITFPTYSHALIALVHRHPLSVVISIELIKRKNKITERDWRSLLFKGLGRLVWCLCLFIIKIFIHICLYEYMPYMDRYQKGVWDPLVTGSCELSVLGTELVLSGLSLNYWAIYPAQYVSFKPRCVLSSFLLYLWSCSIAHSVCFRSAPLFLWSH